MTLGELDQEREERFIKVLNYFKDACNKDDGNINLIIGNVGKHLYNKLYEDGLIKQKAFLDIESAASEYYKRQAQQNYSGTTFITSSISNFSDVECSNEIIDFLEKIGVNRTNFAPGGYKDETLNAIKKIIIKFPLIASYINGTCLMMPYEFQWRLLNVKDVHLYVSHICDMDLIRYINGVYKLENNKVIITSNKIYGDLILNDFLIDIYKNLIQKRVSAYHDPYRYYRSCIGVEDKDCVSIEIYPQNQEEKEQLDIMIKYGYLSKHDSDDRYYFTNISGIMLPSIASKYKYYLYAKFYDLFALFWLDANTLEYVMEGLERVFSDKERVMKLGLEKEIDFKVIAEELLKFERYARKLRPCGFLDELSVYYRAFGVDFKIFEEICLENKTFTEEYKTLKKRWNPF